MSIWEYPDAMPSEVIRNLFSKDSIYDEKCLYCNSHMTSQDIQDPVPLNSQIYKRIHESGISTWAEMMRVGRDTWEISGSPDEIYSSVYSCPVCGWWKFVHDSIHYAIRTPWHMSFVSGGVLRNLDLTDIHLPLSTLRQYLAAHYSARFDIHPRKFEEVVASVFRDLGYYSFVTGYTHDGGIDVILERSSGEQVGVQVKRSKNRIEVEQIRSFLGALVDNGFSKGIFVATSNFGKGAKLFSGRTTLRQASVELMDAERFLQALKIGQLKHPLPGRFAEGWEINMECVSDYMMNSL